MERRILVIDDEGPVREFMARALAGAGYAVATATDGREGVAAAHAEPPDLVVVDVNLPHLDGYGVLAQLRAQERTAGIPIVFCSGDSRHREIGRALGVQAFLAKPFSRSALLMLVNGAMPDSEPQP